MKKLTSIFAALFLMTLSVNVFAQTNQSTATESATASARIMTAIAIDNTGALRFGTISSSNIAGTVVIEASATGTRDKTGGVVLSAVDEGGSASYTVTGENNATYTISLPGSITVSDGTHNMTVDNFQSNYSDENIGTLSGTGSETIYVGATLNVNASQAAGDYTGTYNVTVSYN